MEEKKHTHGRRPASKRSTLSYYKNDRSTGSSDQKIVDKKEEAFGNAINKAIGAPSTESTNPVPQPAQTSRPPQHHNRGASSQGPRTSRPAGDGAILGTFSASPSGLLINATTGVIDLSASTPGTYTITNYVLSVTA